MPMRISMTKAACFAPADCIRASMCRAASPMSMRLGPVGTPTGRAQRDSLGSSGRITAEVAGQVWQLQLPSIAYVLAAVGVVLFLTLQVILHNLIKSHLHICVLRRACVGGFVPVAGGCVRKSIASCPCCCQPSDLHVARARIAQGRREIFCCCDTGHHLAASSFTAQLSF